MKKTDPSKQVLNLATALSHVMQHGCNQQASTAITESIRQICEQNWSQRKPGFVIDSWGFREFPSTSAAEGKPV